jgi:hypothetical protein
MSRSFAGAGSPSLQKAVLQGSQRGVRRRILFYQGMRRGRVQKEFLVLQQLLLLGARKIWPALALVGSWAGCAEPRDDAQSAHDEDATESSEQQLTVAEPLRGMYHWDAPNGPALTDAAARWLGREHDVALAFAPRANFGDLTGPSWQLPAWGRWVQAKSGDDQQHQLRAALDHLHGAPGRGSRADLRVQAEGQPVRRPVR